MENPESGNIWDNSIQNYIKGNFKIYWELLPVVSHYQFKCMTGDEKKDYLTYTIEYIKENMDTHDLSGLSIGCGEGASPEMRFFETGYFSSFKIMDIAEGLLNRQRQIAINKGLKGIEYIKKDLNYIRLEENTYDLIWAVGTVHHLKDLEAFFYQIQRALKKSGIFVMREYVGPNRIQLSDKQLSIVNEILSVLPEEYKLYQDGKIKNIEERANINEMKKIDPSEAIRSQDILSILRKNLELIHFAETGGAILHPLLNGIASNFEKSKDSEAILKVIILLERILIESRVIPSDYVFCIAKKKKGRNFNFSFSNGRSKIWKR